MNGWDEKKKNRCSNVYNLLAETRITIAKLYEVEWYDENILPFYILKCELLAIA